MAPSILTASIYCILQAAALASPVHLGDDSSAIPRGALSTTVVASNVSANGLQRTFFNAYGDRGCKNLVGKIEFDWDSSGGFQDSTPVSFGTFQSAMFTGGANAQQFSACQYGHSCGDARIVIFQDTRFCSSSSSGDFDKVAVSP